MSSNDPRLETISPMANWDEIYGDVNGWRGACLHHFSSVEMAVTETLLALSEGSAQGETIRLRQLIGQRFEDLASAIGPGGPFLKAGEAALAALARYRDQQETFRALLCHGTIKVVIDQHGQWTLIIRSLSIRSRQPERGLMVLERAEAQARLAELKTEGQKLTSQLGQLRKTVQSP